MSKTGLYALMILAGLAVWPAQQARADAAKTAAAVPPAVSEIATGGRWMAGGKSGIYRAVVIEAGDAKRAKALIFLQWLAVNRKTGSASLEKSVAIKELNSKSLSNAFLTIDAEKENEITLIITSYDPKADKDLTFGIKPTGIGAYKMTKVKLDE